MAGHCLLTPAASRQLISAANWLLWGAGAQRCGHDWVRPGGWPGSGRPGSQAGSHRSLQRARLTGATGQGEASSSAARLPCVLAAEAEAGSEGRAGALRRAAVKSRGVSTFRSSMWAAVHLLLAALSLTFSHLHPGTPQAAPAAVPTSLPPSCTGCRSPEVKARMAEALRSPERRAKISASKTASRRAVRHRAVLCCAVLCYTALCCAVLLASSCWVAFNAARRHCAALGCRQTALLVGRWPPNEQGRAGQLGGR